MVCTFVCTCKHNLWWFEGASDLLPVLFIHLCFGEKHVSIHILSLIWNLMGAENTHGCFSMGKHQKTFPVSYSLMLSAVMEQKIELLQVQFEQLASMRTLEQLVVDKYMRYSPSKASNTSKQRMLRKALKIAYGYKKKCQFAFPFPIHLGWWCFDSTCMWYLQ